VHRLNGEPVPASWTESDTILITAEEDGGIHELPANGGMLVPLTRGTDEGRHLYPQMLPGRRGVLFSVAKSVVPSDWDIVVETLDGRKDRIVVAQGSHARYLPSGHIVFARSGTLLAVPFDVGRVQVTGAEVVVLEHVMHGERGPANRLNIGAAQFSVADAGTLAYVPGGSYPPLNRHLLWVERSGRVEPLPLDPDTYGWPRLSPDGKKLAYGTGDFGYGQLWVYDIEFGTSMKLTRSGHNGEPVWSPDGRRLVFDRLRGRDVLELYEVPVDGSGEPQLMSGARGQPSSWSVANVLAFVTERGVSTLRMDGGSESQPFAPGAVSLWPDFSPDGKWLAYASNETGRFEVYVRPFPAGAPVRISPDGGSAPLWARNGQELFYLSLGKDAELMVVDVVTEPAFQQSRPRLLFKVPTLPSMPNRNYDVARDGRFVFVSAPVGIEPQPVAHVNIVLNWVEELKRLVPIR
jgi:serine/threonine-protein kinase